MRVYGKYSEYTIEVFLMKTSIDRNYNREICMLQTYTASTETDYSNITTVCVVNTKGILNYIMDDCLVTSHTIAHENTQAVYCSPALISSL